MTDPAVSVLANVADAILATAAAGLEAVGRPLPGSVGVYHSTPPDDCCDHLTAFLRRIRPTLTFPSPAVLTSQCAVPMRAVDIGLRLRRSCWPTVTGSPQAPFPPAAATDAAARDLLADADAIFCAVVYGWRSGDLLHGIAGAVGNSVAFSDFAPMTNQGGCAGWDWTITVELDPCCPPPLPDPGP